MLEEILSEVVSYRIKDGKFLEKDTGYNERLVSLIKIPDGEIIKYSDIANLMDKDVELEKAL
jgi:hypothetical protein